MATLISVKQQKKINKKRKRIKRRLAESESLFTYDEPSNIICLYNGGLDNAVGKEELFSTFCKYGKIYDIIMFPRKSYCFICYESVEAAVEAEREMTGYVMDGGENRTQSISFYAFFVHNAPAQVLGFDEPPNGLQLLEDFITLDTEQTLLDMVSLDKSTEKSCLLKHRAVRHYGYTFRYDTNDVDLSQHLADKIPQVCLAIVQRAIDQLIISSLPDQMTVNRYLPGQGIPPHMDNPTAFADGILSLSCGSQVVMEFRQSNGKHFSITLPPRSLLVMTGESRYVWTHAIAPRKSDIVSSDTGGLTLVARGVRTSFTFRKVVEHSDDKFIQPQVGCPNSFDSSLRPLDLELEHVYNVYENIAEHFSSTRHKPWPMISQFLLEQPPNSIVLDTGCGNGKYFGIKKNIFELGCDHSPKLAGICQKHGHQVIVADALDLPLRSCCVDVCLCIAVIHHLSTQVRRRRAVEELVRVLRPGGRVLIYVWAMEQSWGRCESKYLLGEQHAVKTSTRPADVHTSRRDSNPSRLDSVTLPVHVNRTEFQEQDVLVPWHMKDVRSTQVFHRYYHVFRQGELEQLCSRLEGCAVSGSYYDQGNWCIVLSKL